MRSLSNLKKYAFLAILLVSNIALVVAVKCVPEDNDGFPLTSSEEDRGSVVCYYEGAGQCKYSPAGGVFVSGSSLCPQQGIPEGVWNYQVSASVITTTVIQTVPFTISLPSTPSTETMASVFETSTKTIAPVTEISTKTTTRTETVPPTKINTIFYSSMATPTTSSQRIITVTTVVIIGTLGGIL